MPHTCPHCSAIFDAYNDICPSCNRPMWKMSWWMTLLKAIFKPKRSTMMSYHSPEGSRSVIVSSGSRPTGETRVITRRQFAFDDGTGMREWSSWEDVPPEIRAKIEALGGGPGAKEGTLTKRESSGSVPLADLPSDLRAQLEAMRGDAEVKRIEITGSSAFHQTERRRGDVIIDRSSSNEAAFRYEDSDGAVHEAARFEDLPPHVQELFRRMQDFGKR